LASRIKFARESISSFLFLNLEISSKLFFIKLYNASAEPLEHKSFILGPEIIFEILEVLIIILSLFSILPLAIFKKVFSILSLFFSFENFLAILLIAFSRNK